MSTALSAYPAGFTQVTVLAAVLGLIGVEIAAAAEPAEPAAIRLASRSIDSVAPRTLGSPVVVTRSDVESPLGRVRSLELDPTTNPLPRSADPAFKAVMLTPRESTGRPAQPAAPDITTVEPEPPRPKDGMKLQSHSPADVESEKPVAPPKERGQPRPTTQQPKRVIVREAAAAPRPAVAAPAPRAAAPRAAAPRYGAAEIAASRAFTRF
jgi:hypothetical protein